MRGIPFGMALILAVAVDASIPESWANGARRHVPVGVYLPLYPGKDGRKGAQEKPQPVKVAAFFMDTYPVTRGDYLEFVRANPRWRRSAVASLFADEGYLRPWEDDLDPGGDPDAPVTHVSWFAARAYCRWRGATLPTVAQWERAARADEKERARILEWYSKPTPEKLPSVRSSPANELGIHGLHGLVWEWTLDFNTALVTGESRGDGSLERSLYCGSGAIGAADVGDYAAFMRYGFRSSLQAGYTVANLGFRCVSGEK